MTVNCEGHLAKAISKLYVSEEFSDLIITCKGRRWKAHRAIVLSQSKVLAALVTGGAPETSHWELGLDDEPQEIVSRMIQFLYTSDYHHLGHSRQWQDEPTTPGASVTSRQMPGRFEVTISKAPMSESESVATFRAAVSGLLRGSMDGNPPSPAPIMFGSPSTIPPRFSSRQTIDFTASRATRIFGTLPRSRKTFTSFADISTGKDRNIFGREISKDNVLSNINGQNPNAKSAKDEAIRASFPDKPHNDTTILTPTPHDYTTNDPRTAPKPSRSLSSLIPKMSILCDTPTEASLDSRPLILHIKLYLAAKKYEIDPLRSAATTKFELEIARSCNTPAFTECLKVIYGYLDEKMMEIEDLKNIAVQAAGEQAKNLLVRNEFVELLKVRGDVATDILRASLP